MATYQKHKAVIINKHGATLTPGQIALIEAERAAGRVVQMRDGCAAGTPEVEYIDVQVRIPDYG